MNTQQTWQWDESIPVGKDFFDRSVVAAYDARHGSFRDIDGENTAILDRLDLQPGQWVGDVGCGTGAFARRAAKRGCKVVAIDVSAAMLDFVQWKAKEEGLADVVCRQGGFLTYEHDGPPLDAIHSSLALHHLPDFWKQRALCRLAGWLKKGGRFHLMDVVFREGLTDSDIEAWLAHLREKGEEEMEKSSRDHIRKEFSTFTWILEGMLERAGFRIDQAEQTGGVLANYYCTRV